MFWMMLEREERDFLDLPKISKLDGISSSNLSADITGKRV